MSEIKAVVNMNEMSLSTEGNGGKFEFAYCRMGPQVSMEKMGCGLFVVPPGKSAFPYHAHSAIEELCIVLEGEGTLRQNDAEQPIRAGDLICSKAGDAHQIVNSSDADIRYLVISNSVDTDVVQYPDSDKILAFTSAFGGRFAHITRRDSAVGYYDGEEE